MIYLFCRNGFNVGKFIKTQYVEKIRKIHRKLSTDASDRLINQHYQQQEDSRKKYFLPLLDKIESPEVRAELKCGIFYLLEQLYAEKRIVEKLIIRPTCSGSGFQVRVYENLLRIFGVYSRLESLADYLLPYDEERPSHVDLREAYEMILTSKQKVFNERECVLVFRERFAKYKKISTDEFLDAVQFLYENLSSKYAPKLAAFAPPPPKHDDIDGIRDMFYRFGINPPETLIVAVQIIVEPLPMRRTATASPTPSLAS